MFIRKSKHERIVAGLVRLLRASHDQRIRNLGRVTATEVKAQQDSANNFARWNREATAHAKTKHELALLREQLADLSRRHANQRDSLTRVTENAGRFGTSLLELIRLKPSDLKTVPYCEALAKGQPACCGSAPCKFQPIAGCAGN
jgi:hypothetical protein